MSGSSEEEYEEEAAAAPAAAAASLHNASITTFQLKEITVDPVFFICTPQGEGNTTLIGSLLIQLQKVRGLDGACILTDRASKYYMGGILPSNDILVDKPFDYTLRKLIELQRNRQMTMPEEPALKWALVADDYLYGPRGLVTPAVQRDIKLAKSYNITIILATTSAKVLPDEAESLATHAMATKCLSTDTPKLLKKKMFVSYDSHVALADTLALCSRHEFLVGILRFPEGSQSNTISEYSRAYTSTFYARDKEFATHGHTRPEGVWTQATFAMKPKHVSMLSHALRVGTDL